MRVWLGVYGCLEIVTKRASEQPRVKQRPSCTQPATRCQIEKTSLSASAWRSERPEASWKPESKYLTVGFRGDGNYNDMPGW